MTLSRPLNPGENPNNRMGTQDEKSFLSRIYLGRIVSVDTDNGLATVRVLGLGQAVRAVIPLAGLSPRGTTSSWVRYMPQRGDFIKVGYGPDNFPEFLGYATFATEAGLSTTGNSGPAYSRDQGYKEHRITKERSDRGDTVTGTSLPLGFRAFVPLQEGEWDMRSSGGAYVHGSATGVVTVSAGQNAFRVDKVKEEITGETQMFSLDAGNNTTCVLGDIKRTIAGKETVFSLTLPDGTIATREFNVQVAQVISNVGLTAVTKNVYQFQAGDVRDGFGITYAPPLVVRETSSNVSGATLHSFTVDVFGNLSTSSLLGMSYSAKTTMDFTAATINLNGGLGKATFSAVCGEALQQWLLTSFSCLSSLGPTGPVISPLTPGVLSTSVKLTA